MDPNTGREFSFTNPQDDPEAYPRLPDGFHYGLDGSLVGIPRQRDSFHDFASELSRQKEEHMRHRQWATGDNEDPDIQIQESLRQWFERRLNTSGLPRNVFFRQVRQLMLDME